MPKKAGRPKKIVEKPVEKLVEFQAVLKLNSGEVYQSEGNTLLESLANLVLDKPIKVRGYLSITNGKRTITKMFIAPKINRMFHEKASPITRQGSQIGFSRFIASAFKA